MPNDRRPFIEGDTNERSRNIPRSLGRHPLRTHRRTAGTRRSPQSPDHPPGALACRSGRNLQRPGQRRTAASPARPARRGYRRHPGKTGRRRSRRSGRLAATGTTGRHPRRNGTGRGRRPSGRPATRQPPAKSCHLMEDRDEITPLLLHPDETAGGLMTSEYIALGRQMWAQTALEAIRKWSPEHEYLYYFVVDKNGTLVGVVSLLQLIKADPEAEAADLYGPQPRHRLRRRGPGRVRALDEPLRPHRAPRRRRGRQTHRRHHHRRHHRRHRRRGHRRHPAVGWFCTTGEALPAHLHVGNHAQPHRLAAPALRHRDDHLQRAATTSKTYSRQVVALAFFIPLLIGTGGNAGSQTTATVIRALGVGEVEKKDALKVLWHEITCWTADWGCSSASPDFARVYRLRKAPSRGPDHRHRRRRHRLLVQLRRFPAAALRLPHRCRSRPHLRPPDEHPRRCDRVVYLPIRGKMDTWIVVVTRLPD